MEWLSKKDDTIFVGQSVSYSGNAIYNTLNTIPDSKKLEVPVFEEIQMGMTTGMALEGLVPISCYPRFDFMYTQSVSIDDPCAFFLGGVLLCFRFLKQSWEHEISNSHRGSEQ